MSADICGFCILCQHAGPSLRHSRRAISLVTCVAPAPSIDYSAPLTADQVAFKQALADRPCTATEALGQCQLDVFARNMTPAEMRDVLGSISSDPNERDAHMLPAIKAAARLLPERKRVCGV